MYLKLLLFFAFFPAAVISEKSRDEVFEKCATKMGMSEDEKNKLFAEGFTEDFFENYTCFFKCVLEEVEVMDPDGTVNEKKLQEQMPDFPCSYSNWTDPCARAAAIFDCARAQDSQPSHRIYYNVSSNCFDEIGSDEEKEEFQNTVILKWEEAETDNPKFKCYFRCVFQDWGWMDEKGDFSKMSENKEMAEDRKNEIAHCFNVTGIDICDKAFNFNKCYLRAGKHY